MSADEVGSDAADRAGVAAGADTGADADAGAGGGTDAGSGPEPAREASADGRSGTPEIPPHHDPACWGCGDAPDGIHLPPPKREGAERYAARFRFDERHQGGPGIVHGGLVAAALDEACGLLATWYRFPAVTARLAVSYRRPVPINTDLDVAARLRSERGRRLHVEAELHASGELLAEARATLVHVPLEHFLVTPEGRAAGEAWRRRLGEA